MINNVSPSNVCLPHSKYCQNRGKTHRWTLDGLASEKGKYRFAQTECRLTKHLGALDRTQRVKIAVERAMEANPALPSSRPSSQRAKQHAEGEHKGTHDYADRSQNPRIARERDSSRVRVLVFILAGTAI